MQFLWHKFQILGRPHGTDNQFFVISQNFVFGSWPVLERKRSVTVIWGKRKRYLLIHLQKEKPLSLISFSVYKIALVSLLNVVLIDNWVHSDEPTIVLDHEKWIEAHEFLLIFNSFTSHGAEFAQLSLSRKTNFFVFHEHDYHRAVKNSRTLTDPPSKHFFCTRTITATVRLFVKFARRADLQYSLPTLRSSRSLLSMPTKHHDQH